MEAEWCHCEGWVEGKVVSLCGMGAQLSGVTEGLVVD